MRCSWLEWCMCLSHRLSTGFGMTGRGAQRCDQGFYNPGNNYESCTACPFGHTTSGPGKGLTLDDCFVGAGYGLLGGKLAPCPTGTGNHSRVTLSGDLPSGVTHASSYMV